MLNLIHPVNHDFYSACRNKLGWSLGVPNKNDTDLFNKQVKYDYMKKINLPSIPSSIFFSIFSCLQRNYPRTTSHA